MLFCIPNDQFASLEEVEVSMENDEQLLAPLLSQEFLAQLVAELDDETVRAIILRGSYARGDAVPPYSDVDLTRIIQETAGYHQPKYYVWRDGYAISVSTHSYAAYRERFTKPEEAIFAVLGVQEAIALLDKDGAFQTFQQEARTFRWEPLQREANIYAGQVMMAQTEIVLKLLRALHLHDMVLLADILTLDLIPAVTEAFAVQHGILIHSGNTYFHQVQQIAGEQSAWTRYHRHAIGIDNDPTPSLEQRGIAALRLFQETARLLRPFLIALHWDAIEPLISMIEQKLSPEKTG